MKGAIQRRRRMIATLVSVGAVCACVIPAAAFGTDHTVKSCTGAAPQGHCFIQANLKSKPKAVVIQASASPAQPFTVAYRVFCQGRGGEIKFAKQSHVTSSKSVTVVVRIPKKGRTHHCIAQAATNLRNGETGSTKLKLKTRS